MRLTRRGLSTFILGLAAAGIAQKSNAAIVFLDNNAAVAGAGIAANANISWEGNVWTGTSAGTGSTIAYTEGSQPEFAAGTDTAAKNYSVTANADHNISVGMSLLTNGGGTVTITGTGKITIPSGRSQFLHRQQHADVAKSTLSSPAPAMSGSMAAARSHSSAPILTPVAPPPPAGRS